MLRMITAETCEIDSPEEAAAEILGQINAEAPLLANTLGIVACHPDFITSGALKAICDKLPFPVVGGTTISSGTNKAYDFEQLSLCVLTSDDVSFTPVLSAPLTENHHKGITDACAAASTASEPPAFALAYLPYLPLVGGVTIVKIVDATLSGVPLFGTIACDPSGDYRDTHVIFNGDSYRDRMALVLIRGAITPKFFVASVSASNIQKQKGIVTDSDGVILKGINDMPCMEYMASIGLNPNDGLEGIGSIPFLVDYKDGSPPAGRSVYSFSPEGHAICGADIPMGASFAVGLLDAREITRAGADMFATILGTGTPCGMLVISCLGRSLALGVEPLAELETVRDKVGETVPLHMTYSGGEICPVYTDNDNTINRFHNFTLIACVLSN